MGEKQVKIIMKKIEKLLRNIHMPIVPLAALSVAISALVSGMFV